MKRIAGVALALSLLFLVSCGASEKDDSLRGSSPIGTGTPGCKGDTFANPDVRGLTLAEAMTRLQSLGLEVRTVFREGGKPPGVVDFEFPPRAEKVCKGVPVTLYAAQPA